MILVLVLCSLALAVQPSVSHPLGFLAGSGQGFDISTDVDVYYGPGNYGNRGFGGNGGYFGGNGGLFGGSRGLWSNDIYIDNLDTDYGYNYGPIRTVDFGRDRVVRDFEITETDNWVHDQASIRTQPRIRYERPRRIIATTGIGGPRIGGGLRIGGGI